MVINNKVIDCTDFMGFHPGGPDTLMMAAGKNGTSLFSKKSQYKKINCIFR